MEKLIIKYLTDSLSDKEHLLLEDWLKKPENKEIFKSFVKSNQEISLSYNNQLNATSAYQKIEKTITAKKSF